MDATDLKLLNRLECRPFLTPVEITGLIQLIRKKADGNDHEAAHALEDQLHQRVLRDISEGAPKPKILATLVLLTAKIKFNRWYA